MAPWTCDPPHFPRPADDAHGHSHSHAHSHHRPSERRALLVCLLLTVGATIVEVLGGLYTESLMLLSDAVHMLTHGLSLAISYAALRLAARPPGPRSHFGYYRAEILGAFANGLGIFALAGWIAWEAFERLRDPAHVLEGQMIAIASFGLVVNLVTAVILGRAGGQDLNTRSAFLHMLGDTISSVVILVGGAVLWATGWTWIDPALSVLIAAVVCVWGVGLVKEASAVLLELSPRSVDLEKVRAEAVEAVEEVCDLHDIHIWEITTGYVCLTAHVVVPDALLSETERIRRELGDFLSDRFRIRHVTLQLETQHSQGSDHLEHTRS